MMTRLSLILALAAALAAPAPAADPAGSDFFEKKVRPILVERCYACHGAKEKPKGGLRLDTSAGIQAGGDSGPIVVAGRPEQSLIITAIRQTDQLKMPPKTKLPPAEIAALVEWVKLGAPLPPARPVASPAALSAAGPRASSHWAYQPAREPRLPHVLDANWVKSPIDRFILAALEARALRPAPPADKRTLLRRVTFDLIGLPPTPQELHEFLSDSSPAAFARVVDRLLASPHYGERWGRHWLDVARYADSNGMDENLVQANAWRYRDYVIAAFNRDRPYDRFVREQLAGDLLPDADRESQIATAFLALGPKMLAEDDPVKMEMDIVDEQIDTVGKTFLGTTLGCARCHDHKYDPFTMADYYGLAGIFRSTKVMENFKVVARWYERTVATEAEQARHGAFEVELGKIKAALDERTKADRRRELHMAIGAIGPRAVSAGAVLVLARRERDRLQAERQPLQQRVTDKEKQRPPLPAAMGATEGTVAAVRIHLRGNHLTLGPEVPRRFPQMLAPGNEPPIDGKQSGRRQLADWLTRPEQPLTARVFVNRVWHWHFGAGLVRSTDNFGTLGDKPSHPQLLDWLARQFIADGWSVKALHRRLLLSNTYQMSATWNESAAGLDPDNRLLWRFPRQRLDAETLRDALLAISGKLERTQGGTLMDGANRAYVPGYPNGIYEKYDFSRRSVYLPVIRSMLYDVFQAFDFADPSAPNGERVSTTVAPQALFMLNAKLVQEQAREFAQALLKHPQREDAVRVQHAYERVYGRPPTRAETSRALDFLQRAEQKLSDTKLAPTERRLRAWQSLCRALLAASEFLYVD